MENIDIDLLSGVIGGLITLILGLVAGNTYYGRLKEGLKELGTFVVDIGELMTSAGETVLTLIQSLEDDNITQEEKTALLESAKETYAEFEDVLDNLKLLNILQGVKL